MSTQTPFPLSEVGGGKGTQAVIGGGLSLLLAAIPFVRAARAPFTAVRMGGWAFGVMKGFTGAWG